MSKTLTISIASYNVEDTIGECVQSCLDAGCANKLDVIVVDDGSKDATAQVAGAYAKEHPDIVRVFSKPNGGYGSTVNKGIELARGRYFRLLDGDDWVDSAALTELVDELDALDEDVDVAIAPYVECYDTRKNVIDQADASAQGVVPFVGDLIPYKLSMHSICYRTQMLRDSGLVLPEHRLYTDTIYDVVPLQLVESAFVHHRPVYMYRMGQEGQSVSEQSLVAHRSDMRAVVDELMELCEALPSQDTLAARVAMTWLSADVAWLCRILLGMKGSPTQKEELTSLLAAVRKNPQVHEACKARSKVFLTLDRAPQALIPAIAKAYGLARKDSNAK